MDKFETWIDNVVSKFGWSTTESAATKSAATKSAATKSAATKLGDEIDKNLVYFRNFLKFLLAKYIQKDNRRYYYFEYCKASIHENCVYAEKLLKTIALQSEST